MITSSVDVQLHVMNKTCLLYANEGHHDKRVNIHCKRQVRHIIIFDAHQQMFL